MAGERLTGDRLTRCWTKVVEVFVLLDYKTENTKKEKGLSHS
jgi:hypothetical protein